MRKGIEQPATLVNLNGPALSPVQLNIAKRFQFCVDAGAAAATGFFDELTVVGLHDHIALSMHMFMRSVHSTDDSSNGMPLTPLATQGCTDAFAAGYLGRIQQELRSFRAEHSGACDQACSASKGCTASAAFQAGRH
jgi:hypothetical protein